MSEKCHPGASVNAGVGQPCAAAEADHPASQPAGQHPCLPEAVHRLGSYPSLLLSVRKRAPLHHGQTAGPRSGHALCCRSPLQSWWVMDRGGHTTNGSISHLVFHIFSTE